VQGKYLEEVKMNNRQIHAYRNKCSSLENVVDDSFIESTNSDYGRVVTILRVGSNPETNSNIWYATVSIFNQEGSPILIGDLPRKAIKLLISEAYSLLNGVGQGEPTKIIGTLGLHVFRDLSNDENMYIDKGVC
jgi:hypothetical protein